MDDLIRKADNALYAAKQAGRDTYRFFDSGDEVYDHDRLSMESALRVALARRSLYPVFQPVIGVTGGTLDGLEVLARWDHAEKGAIPASTFVALAEDAGLIRSLGESIVASACEAAQGKDWPRLWLNVSALEIRSRDYTERLLDMLNRADWAPDRVQLELTERVFLEPNDEMLNRLQQLREQGLRIAIDDFGVGSTSLRALHALPVDVLKIDRSFVAAMGRDARQDALVQAVIAMGHALSLEVVAEGVEHPDQAVRLRQYGCDMLQGFLFSPPLAMADFEQWLDGDAARQRQRQALLAEDASQR
jgi:EAL domain-containing protein (putative c-di-GMP-specific phosphodiesterase class I)